MSDYCKGCKFDPTRATGEGSCPFTALYWSFLERNSDRLSTNRRLAMPYATLHKKTAGEREALRARAAKAIGDLASVPRPDYEAATRTESG
jgi:deoxyribodipyrimidine photolyase-related protein